MKEQIANLIDINQSDLSIYFCKSVRDLEEIEIEFNNPKKYDTFVSIYINFLCIYNIIFLFKFTKYLIKFN